MAKSRRHKKKAAKKADIARQKRKAKQTRSDICYFLEKVPAEIRNRIYELAIVQENPITIYREPIYGDWDPNRCDWNIKTTPAEYLRPSALLQTNTQIRSEAAPMYYSQNTFAAEFEYSTDDIMVRNDHIRVRYVKQWLAGIGEMQAKWIKNIILEASMWDGQRLANEMAVLVLGEVRYNELQEEAFPNWWNAPLRKDWMLEKLELDCLSFPPEAIRVRHRLSEDSEDLEDLVDDPECSYFRLGKEHWLCDTFFQELE